MIHQCVLFLANGKLWTYKLEPVARVPSDKATRVPAVEPMYYPPAADGVLLRVECAWSAHSGELVRWVNRHEGHPDRPAMFKDCGKDTGTGKVLAPIVRVVFEMEPRNGVWLPKG
jgi:hypothetical protein